MLTPGGGPPINKREFRVEGGRIKKREQQQSKRSTQEVSMPEERWKSSLSGMQVGSVKLSVIVRMEGEKKVGRRNVGEVSGGGGGGRSTRKVNVASECVSRDQCDVKAELV